MNIDKIIEMIIAGDSFRVMARKLKVPLSTLHDFTRNDEHSARVRNALEISAQTYEEIAEETLLNADASPYEMQRARELAQHYRWKASKRSPKKYGDKIDMTTDNKPLQQTIINVTSSESAEKLKKYLDG
jgi:hypothetical protein